MRVLDNFSKKLRVNFQRLIQSRKRVLAGATPTRIGEMSRGDAVLLSTCFAGSNHRHDTVLPFSILIFELSRALCNRGKVANFHWHKQSALRGLALHLHSGPLLQQRQGRGIVEVLVPLFRRHLVNLLYGFQRRQLHPRFLGRLQRQADILVHEP